MTEVVPMTEHRRLTILKLLARSPEYTSNAAILQDMVRGVGVASTESQMCAALAWLDEHELVRLVDHGDVVVAVATARGVEVSHGRAAHPGVARPAAR